MADKSIIISPQRRVAAWSVHLFTATGAVLGLFALYAVHQKRFILAFWLMAGAIFVDTVDGTLARRAQTKIAAPGVDGAMLDNIIDYLNYVIVPAFFLLLSDLLPPNWLWRAIGTSAIVLTSAFQFSQTDAKTEDHFFKGFPSYWNIIVFYLFFWQTAPWLNLLIILILAILVFIPIKYIYPSRMDYLTHKVWLRRAMLLGGILWGLATLLLLLNYPQANRLWVIISMGYTGIYVLFSLYRTFVPLERGISERKDKSD